jgi:hypothetical protein
MAKKIILTEGQLRRISSLINEKFDSHIYDLILDKYNEVGLEGMDEDEVAYLKSGGETEIPVSFKEPEKKYDIDLGNEYDDDDNGEDVNRFIQTLDEILDMVGMNNIEPTALNDTKHVLTMPFDENYFQLLMENFNEEVCEYTKVFANKKSTKMGISIPSSWFDKLFGANRL